MGGGQSLHFPSGAPVLHLASRREVPRPTSRRIWILFRVPLSHPGSPGEKSGPRGPSKWGGVTCFLYFFFFLFFLNKGSFLYNHELCGPSETPLPHGRLVHFGGVGQVIPVARPAVDRQRREGRAGPENLSRHGVQRPGQARLGTGRVPGGMSENVSEPLRLARRVVAGQRVLQAAQGRPRRPRRRHEGQVHRRLSLRGGGTLREEVVVAPWPVVLALVICGAAGRRVSAGAGVRKGGRAPSPRDWGARGRRALLRGREPGAGLAQTPELFRTCPPASFRVGNSALGLTAS